MGKTRVSKEIGAIKKIRDIKATLHTRLGMIKDRNDKDLTETEEINRWQ